LSHPSFINIKRMLKLQ